MQRVLFLVVAHVVLGGCGGAAPDPGIDTPPPEITDPTDADEDGIPEQLEDHLMTVFGPELRLAPDDIDWTRPASVDWYLSRVQMRFDHAGCPDDGVIALGAVTADNIHDQQHYTKASGTGLCQHNDGAADLRRSREHHLEFFLQPADADTVHAGIPPADAAQWRAYTQVRPSGYVRADGKAAAYDLQVWYFFPYNDFVSVANHEADWEHLTISVAEDLSFVSVFFASHNTGHRFDDPAELAWSDDTHVVGYVADGSHATYATAGTHAAGFGFDDHTYDGGPVWRTWDGFVNLGQIDRVLDDQQWARYGGRWGEVGELAATSGPPGPMFNGKWDPANEYPP